VTLIHLLQIPRRGHRIDALLDDEPFPEAFFLALCLALIRPGEVRTRSAGSEGLTA